MQSQQEFKRELNGNNLKAFLLNIHIRRIERINIGAIAISGKNEGLSKDLI